MGAFNAFLEEQCRKRQRDRLRDESERIGERLQRDLAFMRPSTASLFDTFEQVSVKVTAQSLAPYKNNNYCVSVASGCDRLPWLNHWSRRRGQYRFVEMPLPNRKTARARGFALADEVGPRMPPRSFPFCFFTKIEHFCFIKAPRTPGVKFPLNRKVDAKTMAGRPRKAEAEKSKQREVWTTDCRWEEIRKPP